MSTVDIRQFQDAVAFVKKAAKKDEAIILNRAGLTCLIGGKGVKGAVQRTPRASAANIKREDVRRFILGKLRKLGRKVTKQTLSKLVTSEMRRRKASIAYTAGPGWHKAIVAMGGRGVKTQKGFNQSEASKGKGRKATESKLEVFLENTAPVAASIGFQPLQEALNDTARDLVEYGTRKLQETFDKVKGG